MITYQVGDQQKSVIINKKKLFIKNTIIQQTKKNISLKNSQTCDQKDRLAQYGQNLTKKPWNLSIKFIE